MMTVHANGLVNATASQSRPAVGVHARQSEASAGMAHAVSYEGGFDEPSHERKLTLRDRKRMQWEKERGQSTR